MSAIRSGIAFLGIGVVLLLSSTSAESLSWTLRASETPAGADANSYSRDAAISDDGRFIVFMSTATNLVTPDTNNIGDVFFLDTQTGVLQRISEGLTHNIGGGSPDISGDGQHVLFVSNDHLYVHDVTAGAEEDVHVATDGTPGNGNLITHFDGMTPRISDDGRFVVFASESDNLVPGDSNFSTDIFIRDLLLGTTEVVSGPGTSDDRSFDMSSDGRYIVFSTFRQLVQEDTNGSLDIYVYDRVLASYDATTLGIGGAKSLPTNSDDGRFIAFDVSNEAWVIDRQDNTAEPVAVDLDGAPVHTGNVKHISDDGRYVAYSSNAPNIVPGGDGDNDVDIYVHDLETGETIRASRGLFGAPTSGSSYEPRLSADGSFVVFHSAATNLIGNDGTGGGADYDVFLFAVDQPECVDDLDCDSVQDSGDNCATIPNSSQANSDGDPWGNACDLCPVNPTVWLTPWFDHDCDGFDTNVENAVGTLPFTDCGFTPGGDPASESWPPDLAETNSINIGDVLALKPVFMDTGPAIARFDIAPNGVINIGDILAIRPTFGASCTP